MKLLKLKAQICLTLLTKITLKLAFDPKTKFLPMWVKSLLFSFPSSEHKNTTSVFGVLKLFWYLDLYFVISPLASCHQTHSLTGRPAITPRTDTLVTLERDIHHNQERIIKSMFARLLSNVCHPPWSSRGSAAGGGAAARRCSRSRRRPGWCPPPAPPAAPPPRASWPRTPRRSSPSRSGSGRAALSATGKIRVQSDCSFPEVSMSKLRNFRKYCAEVGQDTQQSCPESRSGAAAAPGDMEMESGPRISYFKGHLGSNIKVVSLRI